MISTTCPIPPREFDLLLGTPNLHTVAEKIKWNPQEARFQAPPELFRRFDNDAFWMRPDISTHKVKIVTYKV